VVSRMERRTKTGNKMGIIGLSDPTGHFEAVLFSEGLAQYRELLEPGAAVLLQLGAELQAKHPSIGAVRSIGLFGIVELIRNRKTRQPMAPFNGASEEMAALGRFFREQGLYTLVRWNTFYTNPPLCINEQQLREAFAIIDKGLEITDKAVVDK